MKDIWKIEKWKEYYCGHQMRSGIRVDYEKNVSDEVKCICKEFFYWIRSNYCFPKRVRIYVKGSRCVKARDGDSVYDIFFWTYNRDDEPYIKIATGDYFELVQKYGPEEAEVMILISIARNLTHYFQWLNDIKLTPIGEERQATQYARCIVHRYVESRKNQ